MLKETDLERLERLCGVRLEDLSGSNIMKFQGSLTGISKLSPVNFQEKQKPLSAKPANDEDADKRK